MLSCRVLLLSGGGDSPATPLSCKAARGGRPLASHRSLLCQPAPSSALSIVHTPPAKAQHCRWHARLGASKQTHARLAMQHGRQDTLAVALHPWRPENGVCWGRSSRSSLQSPAPSYAGTCICCPASQPPSCCSTTWFRPAPPRGRRALTTCTCWPTLAWLGPSMGRYAASRMPAPACVRALGLVPCSGTSAGLLRAPEACPEVPQDPAVPWGACPAA